MLALVGLFFFISSAVGADFCIKRVENPYPEPYLDFTFRKRLERAILETGNTIVCKEGSQEIIPKVELLKETPIAFTPQQRVSAYNLELRVSLTVNGKGQSFSTVVPYSQPDGSFGDLPRRGAIEDAFGIIYIEMLEFIKRSEEGK
ncbi:MAG: hypothetical protein ACK42C_04450 [Aquificaceae bacterium]|uniref:hypothetical protein n=1 Tax=Hydrogenobacter sp. Uz 6-8 TaxID=3384828 RepID=UPI0030ABB574